MYQNVFFSTIRSALRVLDTRQRRATLGILFVVAANSFIDVLGLALILPVLYLANDTGLIHSNPTVERLFEAGGFVSDQQFMLALFVALFLGFLIKNVVAIYFTYIQSRYAYNIATELIDRQFRFFLEKGYLYFKSNNSNYILRDIAGIPTEFANLVLLALLVFATELLVVLLIIAGIAVYDIRLFGLIVFTLFPVFFLFYNAVRSRIHRYGVERNDLRPKSYKLILQTIHGYTDVRMSNRQQYFIDQSQRLINRYHQVLNRLFVFENTPSRVIEMAALLGILLIFLYSSYLASDAATLMATLIVFATAAYRIMPSLNRMLNAMVRIKSAQYVFDLLALPEEVDPVSRDPIQPLPFQDAIELRQIRFSYPEKDTPALNNINLHIPKGSIVGFIGPSGSGKSTLMLLLLRLIEQESGEMLVDGKPLDSKSRPSWTQLVGYVQQNFYLLDASLAENIALGVEPEKINRQKLADCLRMAQLDELLSTLPHGADTNIGEFGARFSGGQRQRIAIARALYGDAEVLVFDEATSALDTGTERDVMDTIYSIAGSGITILIIAHRLTTLARCDTIYELREGEITNTYTYEELNSIENQYNTGG